MNKVIIEIPEIYLVLFLIYICFGTIANLITIFNNYIISKNNKDWRNSLFQKQIREFNDLKSDFYTHINKLSLGVIEKLQDKKLENKEDND